MGYPFNPPSRVVWDSPIFDEGVETELCSGTDVVWIPSEILFDPLKRNSYWRHKSRNGGGQNSPLAARGFSLLLLGSGVSVGSCGINNFIESA